MNKSKWLVLAAALGMMAATGCYLVKAHRQMRLGAPGVKVGRRNGRERAGGAGRDRGGGKCPTC